MDSENSMDYANDSVPTGRDDHADYARYLEWRELEGQRARLDSAGRHGPILTPGPPSGPSSIPVLGRQPYETALQPGALVGLHDRQIDKPSKYDGRRENDACENWLQRVRFWFNCQETISKIALQQDQRVAMAGSLLTGNALNWFLIVLGQNKPDEDQPLWTNFEEWASLLEAQFGDIRTQETRRDYFDSLQQRKTVVEFYNLIQAKEIYLDPRPSAYECLRLFKRGLKPDLRASIELLPDSVVPQDFDGYAKYAMKREHELYKNKHRLIAPRPTHNRTQGQASPLRRDIDGDTIMTLDALNLKRPGKVASKADHDKFIAECREKNLCFGCGSEDHRRTACPTNPPDRSKNRVRSPKPRIPFGRGEGAPRGGRGNYRGKGRRL
jgi:hypothetical protein